MGLSFDAFLAGHIPKIKPIATENINARRTDDIDIRVDQPANFDKITEISEPNIMPSSPPKIHITIDSIINWKRMSLLSTLTPEWFPSL